MKTPKEKEEKVAKKENTSYLVGFEKVDGENYKPVSFVITGDKIEKMYLFDGNLPKDISVHYIKRHLQNLIERI